MYRVCAALAALLIPVSAMASASNMLCAPHADLLDYLRSTYAELPAASGRTADGAMFEILASQAGSWTLIVTKPDGNACAEASGHNWHQGPLHAVASTPRT